MKSETIKILFVRPQLDVYGACKVMFQLAEGLRDKGHEIIFASANCYDFRSQFRKKGFPHYTVPFLREDRKNLLSFLSSIIKIGLIVRKEKISIIHSHHRWSSFISFFVSRGLSVPLVTTLHGLDRGNKLLTLWGDKIISVSNAGKKHLLEYFKVSPKSIKVIHNGIDLFNLERLEIKTKHQDHSSLRRDLTIANIARLSPEKDQESLFLALKQVLKDHPRVQLLMVGKGPLEKELKRLSEALGIDRNVEFVGEVEDVSPILARIDFLVMSSLTEGLPISILEALAFAKPVVATNVGDIAEVVLDGQTGYIVPPGDHKGLARAISFLLENRERVSEMGLKGRDLVQEKFSFDRMVLDTEKVYLDLVRRKKEGLPLERCWGMLYVILCAAVN